MIRASDPETRAGRVDARHGVAKVIVPLESRANQLLQLLILENLEPFEVGERRCLLRRKRIRRAEVLWNRDRRPLIIWPNSAA